MRKIINKISCDELLAEAAELLKAAFASKNLSKQYQLYHEAEDIKRIAKIVYRYETMKDKGDYQ